MAEASQTATGVEDLIARIRDEGVQASHKEADRILREAREQAAAMVAEARTQADGLRRETAQWVESERQAADEALKLAARDATMELRDRIVKGFERYVERLVSTAMVEEDLVRPLVLVLAGHAAEDFVADHDVQIALSAALFGTADERTEAELDAREKNFVLGISSEMLREGIELVPADDITAGARVRLVGANLELDLTHQAVSRLLLRYLLPRFVAIAQGGE